MGHVRLIPSNDHKINKGPYITGDLSYKGPKIHRDQMHENQCNVDLPFIDVKTFTSLSVENMMYTIFERIFSPNHQWYCYKCKRQQKC
jgi:hypothetical protein